MIKDFITSFKDNIVQKTTNPFLGTFIIVWIIRNWKFVFSLFNFDKDFKLNDRLLLIDSYFKNYNTFKSIGSCIIIAIIILIITYSLLALSRLIINFFEKIITPLVYKLTDKSSIVLKTDYSKLRQAFIKLEVRLDEERDAKMRLQSDYENLEKQLAQALSQKQVSGPSENGTKIEDNSKAIRLLNKLKNDGVINDFENISRNILNEIPMPKDYNKIFEFTSLGLMEPSKYINNSQYQYKFTADGHKAYEILLNEKLK